MNKANRKKLRLNPISPTRINFFRPVRSDNAPQSGAVKKKQVHKWSEVRRHALRKSLVQYNFRKYWNNDTKPEINEKLYRHKKKNRFFHNLAYFLIKYAIFHSNPGACIPTTDKG